MVQRKVRIILNQNLGFVGSQGAIFECNRRTLQQLETIGLCTGGADSGAVNIIGAVIQVKNNFFTRSDFYPVTIGVFEQLDGGLCIICHRRYRSCESIVMQIANFGKMVALCTAIACLARIPRRQRRGGQQRQRQAERRQDG